MKVWTMTPYVGIESLEIEEREAPRPAEGEVLVRIRAASLNHRDLAYAAGANNTMPKDIRFVPLSDGAGEVVEVGAGVTRVKPGDSVAPTFFQGWQSGPPPADLHKTSLGWPLGGVLSEYVCVRQDGLVATPGHLTYEEASTLPCAALTAWVAMAERFELKSEHQVLLLGTGGVSVFALQFAKATGARVIITSSSDDKLARAREMGADETINYSLNQDWEKTARDLAGDSGIDLVLEVGGPGTLDKSLRAVKPGGVIALIGVLAGRKFEGNIFLLANKNARMEGIYVGARDHFERMNSFVARHTLRLVIDRVFSFEDAPAAFRHLESGAHFGKVVIRV